MRGERRELLGLRSRCRRAGAGGGANTQQFDGCVLAGGREQQRLETRSVSVMRVMALPPLLETHRVPYVASVQWLLLRVCVGTCYK